MISFTVETDGKLQDGTSIRDAILKTDLASGSYPLYYMINCAHPSHFADQLESGVKWTRRIRGIRANASCKSHEELGTAEELDLGNTEELAQWYIKLKQQLPDLMVYGGCCGTDVGHIKAIFEAVGNTNVEV